MDPYSILGVGRQATPKDIQRAYRRLALKFHPDRNPSAEARVKFQELQDAYDLLSDPVRRRRYDAFGADVRPVAPAYTYTSPAPPPASPADDGEKEMISRSSGFVRMFSLGFMMVCFVVAIDFLLPSEITYDEVVEAERYGATMMLYTASGNSFGIEPIRFGYFQREPTLTVTRSRILHVLVSIHTVPSNYSVGTPGSFYGTFIFVPVLWLLLAITGAALWKKPRPRFYLMVIQVFFLLVGLALLLTSRWNS